MLAVFTIAIAATNKGTGYPRALQKNGKHNQSFKQLAIEKLKSLIRKHVKKQKKFAPFLNTSEHNFCPPSPQNKILTVPVIMTELL